MPRIPTPDLEDAEDDVIVPLTAQEVQALRKRQPLLSVWRVIVAQVLAGLLTAGLAGWWFGGVAAQSALFGSAAVAVPAALFALGLSRRAVLSNAGSAVFGFFLWEWVKLAMTVLALALAPSWIQDLSWPALLAGLLVTMKVYWVALGMRRVFYPAPKI